MTKKGEGKTIISCCFLTQHPSQDKKYIKNKINKSYTVNTLYAWLQQDKIVILFYPYLSCPPNIPLKGNSKPLLEQIGLQANNNV